jgi:hypothetical protein
LFAAVNLNVAQRHSIPLARLRERAGVRETVVAIATIVIQAP